MLKCANSHKTTPSLTLTMIDIFIISYSKSEAAELSWLQLWGETTFFVTLQPP